MGHIKGVATEQSPMRSASASRHQRVVKRRKQLALSVTNGPEAHASTDMDASTDMQASTDMETAESDDGADVDHGVGTMTDLSMENISSVMDDNMKLRQEVQELKTSLKQASLDEDAFCDNDSKVSFYTGLPTWYMLTTLLSFIAGHLQQSSRCALSPFQQLILTLMKLRLNLPTKDLSERFRVSVSTVSRTFLCTLNVLHSQLKALIIWPDRDALQKTMPMCFRRYCPRAAVIIDCFEIFVDRPVNPLARAQSYSQYKSHNTVKFLIGITPQGTVCFISEPWGGRVSDKRLTDESGLLDHLTPGDVILADRGFDIQESVGLFCATIRIPAFTRGKKQLAAVEVEQTRRIANVRIHVERVIGLLRNKYAILSACQPIDYLSVPDSSHESTVGKMVTVCCALVNMCDSVVPSD